MQQAQAAALSAYVGAAAKVERARDELARHEDAARCALGQLASTSSPAFAAELTGVSVGVARDALAAHRRDTAAEDTLSTGTVTPAEEQPAVGASRSQR